MKHSDTSRGVAITWQNVKTQDEIQTPEYSIKR